MEFLLQSGEEMNRGPLNPNENPLFSKPETIPVEYWGRLEKVYRTEIINFNFMSRPAKVDLKNRKIIFTFPIEHTFQLYLVILTYLFQKTQKNLSGKIIWVLPNELKGGIHFFKDSHPIDTSKIIQKYENNIELLKNSLIKVSARTVNIGDLGFVINVFDDIFLRYILWIGDEDFPTKLTINVQKELEDFFPLDVVWAMINVVNQILTNISEI